MAQTNAEVVNTALNRSVVFVKVADAAFTGDYWKVVVHFQLTPYEKAIEIVKTDLAAVTELAHPTPLIDEVHQVQTVVNSLESTLTNLKRYLPRAERKRGLLNVGGSFLKVLFGTATVTDVADLHSTVDSLSQKQGEVVHALNHQLTYIKQMDATVRTDHEAIANWSMIVRDFALKSQEKFQKTVTRLEWSIKLQEATNAVRQLEFTLTQLELQVNKILDAFFALVTGRLPPNLLQPDALHNILTNVTLNLPEGLNLIVGSGYADLPWYYQNVKSALLADVDGFLLVMNFPLTSVDRNYEIYETIAFPFKIANSTYWRYQLESRYLALNLFHKTYLAMGENMFEQCRGQSVKVCPADVAVTDTRAKSCALSLFKQKEDVRETCQRIITILQPSSVLKRIGGLVVYFTPEERTAHLRCHNKGAWTTTHLVLRDSGLLKEAQSCQISLGDLQLYAAIRGSSQFDAPSEPVIITAQLPITSDSELQSLEKVMDAHSIDQLIARVNTQKMEADLSDLVSLDPLSTTNPVTKTQWTTPLLLVTTVIVVLAILYYCTCTHKKWLRCCVKTGSRTPTLDPVSVVSPPTTLSSTTQPVDKDGPSTSEHRPNFTMYAVRDN